MFPYYWGPPVKKEIMSKTLTMDLEEYNNLQMQITTLKQTISAHQSFEDQIEDLLLSSKEEEKKKDFVLWVKLTRSQVLERIELLVNRYSDKDYEEAVHKWEKKLGAKPE